MAKKKAKKSGAKKPAVKAAAAAPEANIAGSTTVPRANVGAAVQAAISFENASRVTAQATDDTRTTFTVSWS
jgi:hypothetical protein